MENYKSSVRKHYTRDGLFEIIIQKLKDNGIEKDMITRKDISLVDEFHLRGSQATQELVMEAGFSKDTKVLDIGCGIGGPARMIAEKFGSKVTGVDLTEEFIRTAGLLSELVGLKDLTEFICADATKLPFADESYDIVWTQHAQMNIKEKKALYSEIYRVLKKGGQFIYYDIFSVGDEPLYFPLPWAEERSISHLITIPDYNKLLTETGFIEVQKKDQTENSANFIKEMFAKVAKEGAPKMGLNLLMKETSIEKLKNVLRNISENKMAVQNGIYQKI
ncbi:MAG TPA: class I SAM-dependent methyltransferase [Ignavibacteria bacterium]|nr:class I SAM-dependent methyltransferase [Ignavibacteria bacterium]